MPLLTLYPDADGDLTQWAIIGAGSSFEAVMDLYGADDDVTFVRETDGGGAAFLVRTRGLPALPHPVASVAFVSLTTRLRRQTGAGQQDAQVAGRIRSGAANFDGPPLTLNSGTYIDIDGQVQGWQPSTDPATGKPWTWPAALASQVGLIDQTDPAVAHTIRCTLVRKLVWIEYVSQPNAVRGPVHHGVI